MTPDLLSTMQLFPIGLAIIALVIVWRNDFASDTSSAFIIAIVSSLFLITHSMWWHVYLINAVPQLPLWVGLLMTIYDFIIMLMLIHLLRSK